MYKNSRQFEAAFERCGWGCGQPFERRVGERSEYDDFIFIFINKFITYKNGRTWQRRWQELLRPFKAEAIQMPHVLLRGDQTRAGALHW
jgi:hypothetical protein